MSAKTKARPAPSRPYRLLLQVLILLLLPLLAYVPAIRGGFIWDDNHMVYNNPLIHAGAKDGLLSFWFTRKNFDYFPLTSTSLWLEWRLWRMNATGYHVVNVILHALSGILGWRILKRLRVPGAWLIAVVFCVHPVAVASVAWIAERKNTLSMVFYLLSFLCFLRYEEAARTTSERHAIRRWYVSSLLAFQAALFSKTAVVTLPVVLLLVAWWQRRRIGVRDLLRTAPFFALSLVMGLVTISFQYGKAIGPGIVRPESMFSRILGVGWCLWFYVYKALVPLNLMMVNPRWTIDPADGTAFLPLLGYLGFIALLWHYRRTWGRHCLAAFGYHAVTLLPVLGFFKIYFMRFSLVGDHWHYFSFIGPVALVVAYATHRFGKAAPAVRRTGIAAAGLVVLLLAGLTWKQSTLYAEEKNLWLYNIRKNPDGWVAHNIMGGLTPPGSDASIEYYGRAIELNPRYQEAYYGLGLSLKARGRTQGAIDNYLKAVALRPDYFLAQNSLGAAYLEQGKADEAVACFEQAIATRPDFHEAYANLAAALTLKGQPRKAEEAIEKAVARGYPRYRIHYGIGVAWQGVDQPENARAEFLKVLRYVPNHPDTLVNLGAIAAGRKDDRAARTFYERALAVRPGFMEAHYNLACLLFRQEHFAESIPHFESAIRINPGFVLAHYNLGSALFNLGRTDRAVTQLQQTVQQFPDFVDAYVALGRALAARKRYQDAVGTYYAALGRAPNYVDAHLGLAEAYVELDRISDALNHYRSVITLWLDNGMTDQASKLLDKAITDATAAGREALVKGLEQQKQRVLEADSAP